MYANIVKCVVKMSKFLGKLTIIHFRVTMSGMPAMSAMCICADNVCIIIPTKIPTKKLI